MNRIRIGVESYCTALASGKYNCVPTVSSTNSIQVVRQ